MHQAYLAVLKDSFFSNFIFTFYEEFAHGFILHFGKYDHLQASLFALIGSTLGIFVSFLIFYLLAALLKNPLSKGSNYKIVQNILNRFGFAFYVLAVIPQVSILVPVFAGLAKVRVLIFLLYIAIYRTAYYAYILYF